MDDRVPVAIRPVAIRSATVSDAPHLAELLTELGYPASAQVVGERLATGCPTRPAASWSRNGAAGSSGAYGFTDVCDRLGRFIRELAGDQGAGYEPGPAA
jgi:hypothetical protein